MPIIWHMFPSMVSLLLCILMHIVHNDNCRLHRWPSVLRLPRPVDVTWAACFMHVRLQKNSPRLRITYFAFKSSHICTIFAHAHVFTLKVTLAEVSSFLTALVHPWFIIIWIKYCARKLTSSNVEHDTGRWTVFLTTENHVLKWSERTTQLL